MLVIVMLLALGAFAWRCRRAGLGLRMSLLTAATLWAATLVGITELLSSCQCLTPLALAIAWGTVLGVLLLTARRTGAAPVLSSCPHPMPSWREACLWLLMGTLLAVTLLLALAATPNNWDAMTYHLPRVAHWIQSRSVAHYPTATLRQLYLGPGAEFILLHFHLLNGDDTLANLPQWMALPGSMVAASLLAQRFGAPRRAQIIAAVFVGTLPMAVLQSVTPQNDLLGGFWLLAALVLLLQTRQTPRAGWAILAGLACGLAALTKPTAVLALVPFVLWIAFDVLRARRLARSTILRLAFLALTAAILLNAGHAARNLALFGHPLGPADERAAYLNHHLTPRLALLTVLRHAATPFTSPFPAVRDAVNETMRAAHDVLAVRPDDPRITWKGTRFRIGSGWNHEDYAGAPLHALIVLATLLAILARIGVPARAGGDLRGYGLAALAACLLFALLLRWQPWLNRLQLPLLMAWAPAAAIVLAASTSTRLVHALLPVMLGAALLCAADHRSNPIFGPRSVFVTPADLQRFANRPRLAPDYIHVADVLAQHRCDQAGLSFDNEDQYEYPLHAMLAQRLGRPARLQHVNVANLSSRATAGQPPHFHPAAIVVAEHDQLSVTWTATPSTTQPAVIDAALPPLP